MIKVTQQSDFLRLFQIYLAPPTSLETIRGSIRHDQEEGMISVSMTRLFGPLDTPQCKTVACVQFSIPESEFKTLTVMFNDLALGLQ